MRRERISWGAGPFLGWALSWGFSVALGALATGPARGQLTLVNMVPAARSGEVNQDSEPSVTINRRHPRQLAASAFTWDNLTGPPMLTANAPIYVSEDGGDSWDVAYSVPSTAGGAFPTGDITLWFSEKHSGSTSLLYTSILHSAEFSMRVFRADDYRLSVPMTLLDTRTKMSTSPGSVRKPSARAPTEARTGSTSASTTGLAGLTPRAPRWISRSTPRALRPPLTSRRWRSGPRRDRMAFRSSRRSTPAGPSTWPFSDGGAGRRA